MEICKTAKQKVQPFCLTATKTFMKSKRAQFKPLCFEERIYIPLGLLSKMSSSANAVLLVVLRMPVKLYACGWVILPRIIVPESWLDFNKHLEYFGGCLPTEVRGSTSKKPETAFWAAPASLFPDVLQFIDSRKIRLSLTDQAALSASAGFSTTMSADSSASSTTASSLSGSSSSFSA